MGLKEWILKRLLKYAPEPKPDDFASHFLTQINKINNNFNHITIRESYLILYNLSVNYNIKYNKSDTLFDKCDFNVVYSYSEGDFPLFIFIMMYLESKEIREECRIDFRGVNTLKILRDEILRKSPDMIAFEKEDDYYSKASMFIAGQILRERGSFKRKGFASEESVE